MGSDADSCLQHLKILLWGESVKVPEIAGCGVFDSRISFGGKTKSNVRRVSFVEIEYYDEDGKTSNIDGREYPICKGNVVVAKPGQTRFSFLHMRNSYLWLVPDDGKIISFLLSLPDVMAAGNCEKYSNLFSEIRKARQFPFSGSDFYMSAKLLELVCLLKADSERHDIVKNYTGKAPSADGIIRASKYMDANFSQKINLEDCAKQANLSTVYFHKLFTEIMGKTPREYLLDRRMSEAMDMLVSTQYELSRIAYECGFGSQSYFNSVFKERTGFTPGDYRKENLTHAVHGIRNS